MPWLLPKTPSGMEEWYWGDSSCSREEEDTQLRLRGRLEVNTSAAAGLLKCQRMIYRGTWTVLSAQKTRTK